MRRLNDWVWSRAFPGEHDAKESNSYGHAGGVSFAFTSGFVYRYRFRLNQRYLCFTAVTIPKLRPKWF